MRLNELILGVDDLRLQSGDAMVDVRDLALDSRRVKAGALFAALPGSKLDGRAFALDAAKAGASAILAPESSTFTGLPPGVAVLTAQEPRRALALIAARFFGIQPHCIAAVTGTGGERLTTDMPKGIGGGASAPSPGWFLRAAQASCVAALIAVRAAATGVVIERLEVSVDSESDDRGILGLDSAIPAGPLSTKVSVSIRARAPQVTVSDLVEWGIEHCPVIDALRRPIPVEVEVSAD